MGERLHEIWERLKSDIQRNPGLWIGVGISAIILVIAYLAYRKQQLKQGVDVPANGYGIPDYAAMASGGSQGTTGYNPFQPASPSLPSNFTTVTPTGATPTTATPTAISSPALAFPAFPAFTLSPAVAASPIAALTHAIGKVIDRAAAPSIAGNIQTPTAAQDIAHRSSPVTAYPIQNPTAAQTAQHRGTFAPLPAIQNPTAAQTAQHRGTVAALPPVAVVQNPVQNPTATQDIAHRSPLPQPVYRAPTHYIIPTTIRPTTVTTRGRVA